MLSFNFIKPKVFIETLLVVLPLFLLIVMIMASQQKISYRSKASEGNSIKPGDNGVYKLGEYEPSVTPSTNKWDEFTGGSNNNPLFVFGMSNLSDVRSWIGHSECPVCKPGIPKKQRFLFRDLQIGRTYELKIIPAYAKPGQYRASVIGGKASITNGNDVYYKTEGYKNINDTWTIVFKPEMPAFILELGNDKTQGNYYLLFDEIDFIPPINQPSPSLPISFEDQIKKMDNDGNQGNWYKDNLWTDKGTYHWDEGYIMDAYVSMYIITKNKYWLDKLISHADSVLSQRVGKVWPEKSTGYNWNGFSGAMTFALARFSVLVQTDPSLLAIYKSKAETYVQATKEAIQYYDKDWKEEGDAGYWIYGSDAPADILKNQVSAYNMQSLLAYSAVELSKYYSFTGDINNKIYTLNKATRFARYFKNKLNMQGSGQDVYYLWKYSETYNRWEDTGHGNFDILFIYNSYKNNIVFSREDVNRFVNTFHRLLPDGSLPPSNIIDGSNIPDVSNAIYYWGLLSEFDSRLTDKITIRFEKQTRYIRMYDLIVYKLVH